MAAPRSDRPVVLTLLGAYWPGNDASGPNQSFRSMATALADRFEFRLVARDRPFGATEPLADAGRWIDLGFAKARYCEARRFGLDGLRAILRETPHEVLWLNGFFDRELTIPALVLRRLGCVPLKPALLSPRGEFGSGALALKSARKRMYLALAGPAGLLRGVTLHATSEDERALISQHIPRAQDMKVVPNIRMLIDRPATAERHDDGAVRLVFVGRIARVKNLDYALAVLRQVTARVTFHIYGPIQEADYWQQCRRLIDELPENIVVGYEGEISNDEVPGALARADLLFLPTKGENFGHAIFEALSCGVPALLSDRTPWRELERQAAGWDLPLAEPRRFAKVIDAYARLGEADRARHGMSARLLAERHARETGAVAATERMLRAMVQASSPGTPAGSLVRAGEIADSGVSG